MPFTFRIPQGWRGLSPTFTSQDPCTQGFCLSLHPPVPSSQTVRFITWCMWRRHTIQCTTHIAIQDGPTECRVWYTLEVPSVLLAGHSCSDTQSCLSLCDPMDYSPPGSFVHGILQARILERVAMPSSKGSSQPRDRTQVSCIAGRFFTVWATREDLSRIHSI